MGEKRRLPKNRPPTSPGEMLSEEFLKPLGLTQTELAKRMEVPVGRISQIVNGKRTLTAETAVRLEMALGMPATFWLGLQMDHDLWHARKAAPRIRPIRAKAGRTQTTPRKKSG